jgi:hypothetical protein
MSRPRPPSAETLACARAGVVAAPPSLTATSMASLPSAHATWMFAPGSGLACLMALLRSSLTTRTASPTAASKIPAALRSAATRWRATATLAGAQGSSTVPAALTSRARATEPARLTRTPCGGDARPRASETDGWRPAVPIAAQGDRSADSPRMRPRRPVASPARSSADSEAITWACRACQACHTLAAASPPAGVR